MRNKRAKQLRRFIYGDKAVLRHEERPYQRLGNGQIICSGDRAKFKRAKKAWKEHLRGVHDERN